MDADDVEGDNDAGGDCFDGITSGDVGVCCSSTARARRKTLAMCSCSSRFK